MLADLTHADKTSSSDDDALTDNDFIMQTTNKLPTHSKKTRPNGQRMEYRHTQNGIGILDFIIAVPGTLFGVIDVQY